MRKIITLLLVAAQLSFAVFLVLRGGQADMSRAKRIREIEENGRDYLFALGAFSYDNYDDPVFDVTLKDVNGDFFVYDSYYFEDDAPRYAEITTADNGVSFPGVPQTEKPESGEYIIADTLKFYYDPDYSSLDGLFRNEDKNYFTSIWSFSGKFAIGGKNRNVFATAKVYEGEVVITGLKIDGVFY